MFHSHSRSCLFGDENKVLCIHYIHISFSFWNKLLFLKLTVFSVTNNYSLCGKQKSSCHLEHRDRCLSSATPAKAVLPAGTEPCPGAEYTETLVRQICNLMLWW